MRAGPIFSTYPIHKLQDIGWAINTHCLFARRPPSLVIRACRQVFVVGEIHMLALVPASLISRRRLCESLWSMNYIWLSRV